MEDKGNNSNLFTVLIVSWPNLISLARLFSVPLIVWMIVTDKMMLAFLTCCIAGLSDILDGFVARILKSPSTVGAYLDPIADKVLLVGLYLTLGIKGLIFPWLVILIVFRDLLIVGGALLLAMLDKPYKVKPIMISKINTLLQIIAVAFVLGQAAFAFSFPSFTNALFILVAITTVFSGFAYVMLGLKYFSQNESP